MDKKNKQRRQKTPTKDELADVNPAAVTPPGASFDTEAGCAAQGMRPTLAARRMTTPTSPPPPDAEEQPDEEKTADRDEWILTSSAAR